MTAGRRCTWLRAVFTLVLTLGAVLLAPAAIASDWIYAARPGDNIWNLTEKHLKSIGYWKALQTYNKVENPRRILPGTRLRIPIRWLKVQPASASVVAVRGQVERLQAGSGAAKPAAVGDVLESGDGLRSGEDSSATVRFADDSLLLVYARTTLVMDAMSAYGTTGMVDTRMRLDRGRVENDVRPAPGEASRYQINTPTAVVAVRGTRFRAAFEEVSGVVRGEVTEGELGVEAGGRRRRLPAGFGIRAEPGKPLEQPVALLPAPDLSGIALRQERILVRLQWPAVSGAMAYRVQVLAPGSSEDLLLDQLVSPPRVEFDAPQDGEYRLRVRAIDGRELEGLDAELQVTVDARPVPPRALGPADQAALLATEPPELWWSTPRGISRFALQLARDPRFDSPLLDITLDDVTRHALSGELTPGMHYWRVASITADGDRGPFGDTQAFRAQAVPDAATASSAVQEEQVNLSWDPLANAVRYELQVATDEEFSELVVDDSTEELSWILESPGPDLYYFRARGVSDEGVAGPYSPVNSFEIPAQPISPAWLLLLAPLLLLL